MNNLKLLIYFTPMALIWLAYVLLHARA